MSRSKPSNLTERPRGKHDDDLRMIRRFMKKIKKFRILDDYKETLVFEKDSTKKRKAKKRRRKVLDKLRDEHQKSLEVSDAPPKLPKKRKTRR